MLLWVIVAANLMAMLVQYLSAKTGIATGKNLPELCREHFKKPVTFGLWLQAEAIAIATDLAEFVGAAIALNLLFGVPPFAAGLITAVVAFAILELQTRGYRRFELAIAGFLGDRLPRLHVRPAAGRRRPGRVRRRPRPELRRHRQRAAGRRHPRRDRDAARRLPALGADLAPDQAARTRTRSASCCASSASTSFLAMGLAGIINITMLVVAAQLFHDSGRTGVDSIEGAHAGFSALLGGGAALAFAVALLASGLSSSSVGTYAGQVVMQGFINRRIPLFLRRAITMAPSLVVLGDRRRPVDDAGHLAGRAVASASRSRWCRWCCSRAARTSWARSSTAARRPSSASVVAALIIALNVFLLYETFF